MKDTRKRIRDRRVPCVCGGVKSYDSRYCKKCVDSLQGSNRADLINERRRVDMKAHEIKRPGETLHDAAKRARKVEMMRGRGMA